MDSIIIGGGMAYTFLKAKGLEVGASLVDEERIELAKELMAKAAAKGVDLMLPVDTIVADKFDVNARTDVVPCEHIPESWMGLDIGPTSRMLFADKIRTAKTVVWNGPGVRDGSPLRRGTKAIARAMADSEATHHHRRRRQRGSCEADGFCGFDYAYFHRRRRFAGVPEGIESPGIVALQDK